MDNPLNLSPDEARDRNAAVEALRNIRQARRRRRRHPSEPMTESQRHELETGHPLAYGCCRHDESGLSA